jgi:murein DD-endopeptidase MepM/ murein hydrolase activator NlpD
VIEMSKSKSVARARQVARVAAVLAVGAVMTGAAVQTRASAAGRAGATTSYQWPLRPFNQAHPVRAHFGDPRTVFLTAVNGNALAGNGKFQFHNGVDIDAPNGSRVYAVESGVVRSVRTNYSVEERADDGRYFIYTHIQTLVQPGQALTAGVTVIGRVKIWNEHLHFSEISANGGVVNPLLPGHLTPYSDTTHPVVAALQVRADGRLLPPFELRGRIDLIVDAYDRPMPVDRARFPVTSFAHDRFGVTPATVTWSLSKLEDRSTVVHKHTVFDFRKSLPSKAAFWQVYARGTYQNRAAITPRYHQQMPGKYLFWLNCGFDTTQVPDGVYAVTVTATDVRGNTGKLVTRIEIRNADRTV